MKLQTIKSFNEGKTKKNSFMDNILEFISNMAGHVATFLGGAAGLKLLDSILKGRRDKTNRLQFNISQMAEVHRAMLDVVKNTPADRFFILKGSNGGGVPRPGSPFYISVMHGINKVDDINHAVENYHKLPIDLSYLEMLETILTKKQVTYKVSEMPEGLLKRIYQAEGVRFAIVFSIAKTESELLYGSIATHQKDVDFSTNPHQLIIEINISKIRKIFSLYKAGVIL